MPPRLSAIWIMVFTGCCALAALAYAITSSSGSSALSYVLWPGVALYTALNGSVLFGGGFGSIGNFFLIAVGSALAWSLLIGLVGWAWRRASGHRGW